jgi:hypothetical protein
MHVHIPDIKIYLRTSLRATVTRSAGPMVDPVHTSTLFKNALNIHPGIQNTNLTSCPEYAFLATKSVVMI